MPSMNSIPSIESANNPKIKALLKLRRHRERVSSGLCLIEGRQELLVAISSGAAIMETYVQLDLASSGPDKELLSKLEEKQYRLISVSRKIFEKIAYRGTTGGLIAVAKTTSASLDNLPRIDCPLLIVADAIEKPGNIGALFRTADAAGVTGVIASNLKTDLWNPNVIRASIGTVFVVPAACCSASDAIGWLKGNDIAIIASSPDSDAIYTDVDMTVPCAIVMGSEDVGLNDDWLSAADRCVRIPMGGIGDSLNISVAATVLIYEAIRQRHKKT